MKEIDSIVKDSSFIFWIMEERRRVSDLRVSAGSSCSAAPTNTALVALSAKVAVFWTTLVMFEVTSDSEKDALPFFWPLEI